jgi:hypothetical protein
MYSLRLENNFLTVGRVHFALKIIFSLHFENNFLTIDRVCFTSKTNFFLSNVFASLQN